MSKKEKATEQTEEKKMTKYDLKMQKRQEAKVREQKEKRRSKVIGIVVLAALVCLIASFPIRTYLALHETILKVDGQDISRVEFDYNYYVVTNNYMDQYGSYMSYFGFDPAKPLSAQMYSDTLTWQDFFDQQTVDSLVRTKALKAEADAAGFTCDLDKEYADFERSVKDAASEAGISAKRHLQQMYGVYATFGRIEEFVKESILVNEYYSQVSEEKTPSDEEILAHYNENRQDYDSVDYYQTIVKAELPTEPTELADPVEEPAGEDAETAYQPSEAEIAKAMEDAEKLAKEAQKSVSEDGELQEGLKYNGITSLIRDWLFDESRKEGDTTVVADDTTHQYYVISFAKRYLDETPSADMRIIAREGDDAQAVLDEWKAGEATEESFGALADQYNKDGSFTAEGGFYAGVTPGGTHEAIAEWLFAEGRAAGDTTAVTTEDGNSYVLYYAGANDPAWKMTARSVVLSDIMEAYMQDITKDIAVEDPEGNLNYLKVEAAADNAAESTEEGTAADDTAENTAEGTAADDTAENTAEGTAADDAAEGTAADDTAENTAEGTAADDAAESTADETAETTAAEE